MKFISVNGSEVKSALSLLWRLFWLLLAIGFVCRPGYTQDGGDLERLSITSNLVNLNVSVYALKPEVNVQGLTVNDFTVIDNGEPRQISFFESSSTPFDLTLLLDLSGSTNDKIDLIKKSCARFVEAARPTDRIGVSVFTTEVRVVSPLTTDRQSLLSQIKKIKKFDKDKRGTNFWDALYSSLTEQAGHDPQQRRRAIVVITDGVDNALPDVVGDGSTITFKGLVEAIQRSNTTILPIYLDTEEEEVRAYRATAKTYELARMSLIYIAQESGGIVYKAEALEKLNSVYETVIRDLGTIYSIGYQPTAEAKPGEWRHVEVKINGRTELLARTKRGYYAK
jgi:VWFA-related protein